jgi:hypothetical protein
MTADRCENNNCIRGGPKTGATCGAAAPCTNAPTCTSAGVCGVGTPKAASCGVGKYCYAGECRTCLGFAANECMDSCDATACAYVYDDSSLVARGAFDVAQGYGCCCENCARAGDWGCYVPGLAADGAANACIFKNKDLAI